MVLLEPPEDVDLETLLAKEELQATPALGFSFFWHARHDQAAAAPGRVHCRLCKASPRQELHMDYHAIVV